MGHPAGLLTAALSRPQGAHTAGGCQVLPYAGQASELAFLQ